MEEGDESKWVSLLHLHRSRLAHQCEHEWGKQSSAPAQCGATWSTCMASLASAHEPKPLAVDALLRCLSALPGDVIPWTCLVACRFTCVTASACPLACGGAGEACIRPWVHPKAFWARLVVAFPGSGHVFLRQFLGLRMQDPRAAMKVGHGTPKAFPSSPSIVPGKFLRREGRPPQDPLDLSHQFP
jgi:hypothetical protein